MEKFYSGPGRAQIGHPKSGKKHTALLGQTWLPGIWSGCNRGLMRPDLALYFITDLGHIWRFIHGYQGPKKIRQVDQFLARDSIDWESLRFGFEFKFCMKSVFLKIKNSIFLTKYTRYGKNVRNIIVYFKEIYKFPHNHFFIESISFLHYSKMFLWTLKIQFSR